MPQTVPLRTHALDLDGEALVCRSVSLFNKCQDVVHLETAGSCSLPQSRGRVDCQEIFLSASGSAGPSITVTGKPLSDNWFSHTRSRTGLITINDWRVNFVYDRGELPTGAPDASLLTSLALSSLLILSGLDDSEILHEETVGCLFDLCMNKPERAVKLRSAYLCRPCTNALAESGLSAIHIDAIRSILECVRSLVIGRQPQSFKPADIPADDDEFIESSAMPDGVALPPRLVEACREKRLTVLVGSGLSLQDDVEVAYSEDLEWERLPSWADVAPRLAECVERYCGRTIEPRNANSLSEFLADLDYFRSVLGDQLYYPRAIFDIFSPHVLEPGKASRLVFRLPVRWILSTNYDFVLQYAAPAGTPLYTWRESRQAREYLEAGRAQRPLLKLHGCASRPDTIVLTTVEYERLRQSQEYVSLLRFVFESQTIFFLGFGVTDPFDLDLALHESRLAGAAEGEKFALLQRGRSEEARKRLPKLQVIPYDHHSQVPAVLAALIRAC